MIHRQEHASRIDEEMTVAAFDLVGGVKATEPAFPWS
jgi:hypothetical protein